MSADRSGQPSRLKPVQQAAIGVQRHLNDAVVPLLADRLVLLGLVFGLAHRS
jgi:hypothetical protein